MYTLQHGTELYCFHTRRWTLYGIILIKWMSIGLHGESWFNLCINQQCFVMQIWSGIQKGTQVLSACSNGVPNRNHSEVDCTMLSLNIALHRPSPYHGSYGYRTSRRSAYQLVILQQDTSRFWWAEKLRILQRLNIVVDESKHRTRFEPQAATVDRIHGEATSAAKMLSTESVYKDEGVDITLSLLDKAYTFDKTNQLNADLTDFLDCS